MNNDHIKELARSRAREILIDNKSFRTLPVNDQRKMYLQVVNEQMEKLMADKVGGVLSMEQAKNRPPGWKDKASDAINDERHDNALDFSNAGEALRDVMGAVDFPKFVGDLLKSVFDANLDVMNAQTQDYIKLMKAATTDLAKFIKAIDNTAAFAYLAENNPGEFNISMEEDADGGEKMSLTDPKGGAVDIGDNEVKARIMDAKIKMAQEHRAALREMILMGVTRLVVEKGEVQAEVLFDFHGKRSVDKKDKAMLNTQKSSSKHASGGTGFMGRIFGGGGGGYSRSDRQTQLSVSSAKSSAADELKTKLRGYVNIHFKTDYFKLDNFAQMYGKPSEQDVKAADPQAVA